MQQAVHPWQLGRAEWVTRGVSGTPEAPRKRNRD
jgi:hypothetical protein